MYRLISGSIGDKYEVEFLENPGILVVKYTHWQVITYI
jgi:hypothetical protein